MSVSLFTDKGVKPGARRGKVASQDLRTSQAEKATLSLIFQKFVPKTNVGYTQYGTLNKTAI